MANTFPENPKRNIATHHHLNRLLDNKKSIVLILQILTKTQCKWRVNLFKPV